MLHDGLLPGHIQDELAILFADAVAEIAAETGIPDAAINISENELALALDEARKDLVVMVTRRMTVEKEFKGLSIGKLAGILVFRLSRYRIVHVDAATLGESSTRTLKIASKLQELAALRFASEAILKVHPLACQFRSTPQSCGSGRQDCINLTMRRSPRVNQEVLLRATFFG